MALNATFTATAASQNPRMVHTGLNVVTGKVVVNTRTVGDTILMVPIPDDAQIVQLYANIGTANDTATATIGTQESTTQFGSFTGQSAQLQWAPTGVPYNVSLSDGKQPHKTYIVVKPTGGSWTTTATIAVTVMYTHDGSI
jgi:hypothetical protein